ncbi:MAG: hypothetical protein ACTSRF_12730 [Candidatus Freyarchaeota archaeon]
MIKNVTYIIFLEEYYGIIQVQLGHQVPDDCFPYFCRARGWALSQWHTTFLFVYFQSVADYYYLLMRWSMKEVAFIDTWMFWLVFFFMEIVMIACVLINFRT